MYTENFQASIQNKNKIRVTFFSKEDGRNIVRLCAPMDIGPSRRTKDQSNRYHLWDFESDKKNHVLSILPEQIIDMEFVQDRFCPSEFVTWTPNWFIFRDWGVYS